MGKGAPGVAAAATTVAVILVLTGCSGQNAPAASPSPTASGSAVPSPSTYTPAPTGAAMDDESGGGTVDPKPAPAWDAAQRAAAIAAAEKAMSAFARPDLSSSEWWAALSPLLTAQAQLDYQYVAPANIPAHKVTGPGAIVDDSSTYAVTVTVPTDAGAYTVILTRLGGASPWLAARFTPPKGTH